MGIFGMTLMCTRYLRLRLKIVWKEIEKYFTNAVIIGHNVAGADLDALVKALNRYNLDIPELYYICTLDLARQYIPSYAVADYSMSTLCEYFGVDIDSEHNAFDDACACADLFKAIIEEYNIDIKDKEKKKHPLGCFFYSPNAQGV